MQLKATTKAGKLAEIKALIDTRDDAVYRVLTIIYGRQTAAEQYADVAAEYNGRGFGGADAEFGSKLARSIATYGSLTPRQLPYGRRIARKYSRQILEHIEEQAALQPA